MKILIAGGKGFLGSHLAFHLRAAGNDVLVATRDPEGGNEVDYQHLPSRVDAVINLAGASVLGRWTQARQHEILNSRVETTRLLVDWMLDMAGHTPVFISGSASGIYGDRPGETLTESSGIDPKMAFRAVVCQAWEREAECAQRHGVRTVLLRTGSVLARDGGAFGVASSIIRRVPLAMTPSPTTQLSWIGIEDWLNLVVWALDNEVSGPLNATAPNPISMREFTCGIAHWCHRPCVGAIPVPLLRLALGEMAQAVTDSQAILPQRALDLGFRFQFPTWTAWLAAQAQRSS